MTQPIVLRSMADLPLTGISLGDMRWNKTGAWRTFRPVYREKTSACQNGCPTGEKVQGYLKLVEQDRLREALALIKEDNPMPGVTGRVCYHPCEVGCNRGQYDQPLSIRAVERYVADNAPPYAPPVAAATGRRVAVVGSGPAGLCCAYHLCRLGHRVTVYEGLSQPGGLLRVGIPSYRLPRAVLDREITAIEALGVEFKTNLRLGENLSWDELAGYDAVFLGTGAHRSRRLGIPGEDGAGVMSGLDFLRQVNLTGRSPVSGRVVVVGGGNTGIDVARCLLRLGAQPINVELLSREDAPASPEEVSQAEAEGVKLLYQMQPQRILRHEGKVVAVECQGVSWSPPAADTGRQFSPLPGTQRVLEANWVVVAIGQDIDPSPLTPGLGYTRTGLTVDREGATSRPKVFAGGDLTAIGRVVDAIGAGKRAARAIDCYLKGEPAVAPLPPEIVEFSQLNPAYFLPVPRLRQRQLSAPRRVTSFAEVNLAPRSQGVGQEVMRCFSCGTCNFCDNCWVFCPDSSVVRHFEDGTCYEFNYEFCKGCGVCAQECPRGVISMEEEKK